MFEEADTNIEEEERSDLDTVNNENGTTLIWFNPLPHGTDGVEKIRKNRWMTDDDILCPTDVDSCINDIRGRVTEKILLAISAENMLKLSQDIIDLPQLDSIFVFTEDRERSNHLRGHCQKIVNVCDNTNDLLNSIDENITQNKMQLKIKPFNDQHQRGARLLLEQEAELLWFRLFKYVIQRSPHDDKAKNEMLSACRQHYENNSRMLDNIDKFDKTYREEKCIEWYTRETFVYRLINEALRTEDIEKLYIYRFYIAGLSRQLAQQFQKIEEEKKGKFCLYRGTTIPEEEKTKIDKNVGQLIAANSYWSTSRDRECALTFAKENRDRSDTTAILYEIECDFEDQNDFVKFADISYLSVIPDEGEYLFDAGSIFEIKSVRTEEESGKNLHIVQIKTTREGQEVVKSYINEIQVEMEYESPRIMIGILLKRIGKYEKSLKYFEQLLKNPGEENVAHIHHRIGIALRLQNKYSRALEHYNKAYDLASKSNPPERVYLAFVRHDQGQIYFEQRKHFKALKYYQEAVDIIEEEIGPTNRYIADYYTSLGRLYRLRREYEEAMWYQREALRIRKECLPPSHVIHAFSYFEIAKTLSFQKNYKEALKYHLEALEFRKKYLPSNHLNTALSLQSVGQMYYKLGDLKKAEDYCNKALEMKRKCLPDDSQPYITPSILQDIARIDGWKSQKALNYRLEARKIQQSADFIHYPSLARLLDDIGFTHKLMGLMNDALQYYKEALKIREQILHKNSFSLSYSFNNLAYLYEAMNDMVSAMEYHCKALEIYESNYYSNHWLCKMSRRSIKRVRR